MTRRRLLLDKHQGREIKLKYTHFLSTTDYFCYKTRASGDKGNLYIGMGSLIGTISSKSSVQALSAIENPILTLQQSVNLHVFSRPQLHMTVMDMIDNMRRIRWPSATDPLWLTSPWRGRSTMQSAYSTKA